MVLPLNEHVFNLIHQNIRSLRSNFDSLMAELTTRQLQPEFIILSEIWIENSEIPFYNIPNYVSYFKTSEAHRAGGVAVYVKNHCNLVVTKCNPVNITSADVIMIEFSFNSREFILIAVYRLHLFDKNLFLRELRDFFIENNSFKSLDHVFLMGDININILGDNDILVDSYNSILAFNGLECLVKEPTRVTDETRTCIDHVFARVNSKEETDVEAAVVDALITDHCMIAVRVIVRARESGVARLLDSVPNSRINYTTLRSLLVDVDWADVYDQLDPSNAFDVFFNILTDAISKSKEEIRSKIPVCNKLKPWITDFICKRIKFKNKMFEKVKKHPENVKLKTYFTKYRNKLKTEIRLLRDTYYSRRFENCKGNSKYTWKVINDVTGQKSRNPENISLLINGIVVHDPYLVSNEFNKYFLSVVDKLNIVSDKPNNFNQLEFKKCFPQTFLLKSMFLDDVNDEDLICAINSLKNSTSPGIDGITSTLIKEIHLVVLKVLLYLINLSFSVGIFPDKLKLAVVIPLHKSNSKTDCNNFRPISLLPTFAKIYEKVMKKKLITFLEKNNIFSRNQFGFRGGRKYRGCFKTFY